jgi:Zn-dependent protease
MQSGLDIAFSLVVLVVSIIIHEVAHGYAANSLGDPTAKLSGRLTLNPLPHIDLMGSIVIPGFLMLTQSNILFGWAKPVPYNPYNLRNQRWGEAVVAVAGGATNILIAIVFALVVRAATLGYVPESTGAFAAVVSFTNLFLGLFNLIPFPPLDGYTVLRGILPFSLSYQLREFENRIHSWGAASLVLILILFAYLFSVPFFYFVSFIFRVLTGI